MERLEWRFGRVASVSLSLLCGAALSGCAIVTAINNDLVETIEKEPAPSNQAQAASAHVAVIAVARWDDYVQDIQPVFAIDAASALRDAIPTTASFRSRLVDATRLGVQVGLPTSGTTATETTTTDAAGVATTISEETTSTRPGATPQSPGFPGTVQGSANQAYLQQNLDQDPFLKYNVASDLFQEVKILNRVLADAKIRDDVEPYFVRLKVALLPYRRQLEFDAYSDINFYLRRQASDDHLIALQELPIVVPLLVTDSLESATDAASAQFLAELAAAISGASQGVALGGQLQTLNDRLTEALANERNSLRTVARLGENAIRVRFGATLQAGPTGRKDYELLPRTHTVSLLVLVPRSAITETEKPVPLA
jgi:hypothetical protein